MIDPMTFDGFREHVTEERFRVLSQPIIDLSTGNTLHYEWLVRFDHESDLVSLLRPAELSGAIRALDLSMLARAVLRLNADRDHPSMSVNLSGASFATPGYKHALMACLGALDADPAKLVIELTESWDIRDVTLAADVLGALQDRGHPICLDDVGAGAASIRYLRTLPYDWLKIDKNFLTSALEDPRERAVLQALLTLRDSLPVRFIAEGLETMHLVNFAAGLGFDAGQGYAIGRPA